jgi:uncharacterized protein YbjT (DUF2867 family)
MLPTILIAGATGNTGRGTVETLSTLLNTRSDFSGHRILALTRSSTGTVAQQFAELPNVQVAEKNWAEITPEWLRQNNVVRAFIASHTNPNQFAEESTFHLAALKADVQYVVRISTTAANVRPDCPAYYPRTHWAIETMLGSPEFRGLRWTSLQPNIFTETYLSSAVEWVKNFRKSGKQETLRLMASEDTPVGIVDGYEVGIFAAFLLAQNDITPHHGAKYSLNGPENITGQQIIGMVEQLTGTKVEDVRFRDFSFIDRLAAESPESKTVILSIKRAAETVWEGKGMISTTSEEVVRLYAPKRAPAEIFGTMLQK